MYIKKIRKKVVVFLKSSDFGIIVWNIIIKSNFVRNFINKMDFGDQFKNAKQYFEKKEIEIEIIKENLEDELSIESYENVINCMKTLKCKSLYKSAQCSKNQYFDPKLPIDARAYANIVDCGAYTGDTLSALYEFLPSNQIEKTFLFEADINNVNKLQSTITQLNLKDVKVFPIAVWNKKEKLSFSSNGNSGSKVLEKGDNLVFADTLDHILQNEKVSMIKMDIEGAEINALEGANNIIINQRPVLAICIYHSCEDMINIPLILMNKLENYVYYIRHYEKIIYGEAVIYAIPDEMNMERK